MARGAIPRLRSKGGARPAHRYTAPPTGSGVGDLDALGPAAAKSFAGQQLLAAPARPAARAQQAREYGRRGTGDVCGAVQPTPGAAVPWTATRRTTANFVAFLQQTDAGGDPGVERISAMLDHLRAPRAPAVVLCAFARPRGEVVFPPQYAASLHLIAPGGTVLRALARKGRRCATGEEIGAASAAATASWNAHRHPFHWGHRRRHRPPRRPGVAAVPLVA